MRAKRALTVSNIINKKRDLLPFQGPWLHSFGRPELRGSWLIWGESGSGKTTLVMQLCKYLTGFDRVLYNSLEEGDSESVKLALIRVGMQEAGRRFLLLDKEPIDDMKERLRKRRAPRIVVIDSIQYAGLNYTQYKELIEEFTTTLFIWISHAEGKNPKGRTAQEVRYDAYVKAYVEGYMTTPVSRYVAGDSEPYIIWHEGATKYHGL